MRRSAFLGAAAGAGALVTARSMAEAVVGPARSVLSSGPANLVPNPGLLNNAAGWSGFPACATAVPGGLFGCNALQLTAYSSGFSISSTAFSLVPGGEYVMTVWAQGQSIVGVPNYCGFFVLDAVGGYGEQLLAIGGPVPGVGVWKLSRFSFNAGTSKSAVVAVNSNGASITSGTYLLSAFSIVKA